MSQEPKQQSKTTRATELARVVRRLLHTERSPAPKSAPNKRIKVAFIHNEKRLSSGVRTGAAQINRLMAAALAEHGVQVKDFYPTTELVDAPVHLKGIANVLFFYSLLEHKESMLKFDIIQGTTYTPLPFLTFEVPIVCHFGSTARGFLNSTPRTSDLPDDERAVYKELVHLGVIPEFDFKTLRPIQDIADVEEIAATQATACVATSNKVRDELVAAGVEPEKVHTIHNAIEDYWFDAPREVAQAAPHLVFLGRLGNDVFTLKLKGLARLVSFYNAFPDTHKTTVCMTTNKRLKEWLRVAFPLHYMYVNMRKDLIPGALAPLHGSVLFLASRYEGFSLSLVEGMSQGLVPIAFSVGVAPEIIDHGRNGYLVTNTDQAIELARDLLQNDEKRLAMAEAAKETAAQFRSDKIASDLYSLYKKLKEEKIEAKKNGSNKKPDNKSS